MKFKIKDICDKISLNRGNHKMKKGINVFLTLCMSFLLIACGSSDAAKPNDSNSAANTDSETSNESKPEEVQKTASWEISEMQDTLLISDYTAPQIRIWFTVKNTGTTNLELVSSEIAFDDDVKEYFIEEANLKVHGRPSIIKPGETGVFTGSVECVFDVPKDTKYSYTIDPVIQETETEPERFDVTDVSISKYENYDGVVTVTGTVKEIPEDLVGNIVVSIILYDANGQFIGTTSKLLYEGLNDGEEQFSASTGFQYHLTVEDIDHYDICAYRVDF